MVIYAAKQNIEQKEVPNYLESFDLYSSNTLSINLDYVLHSNHQLAEYHHLEKLNKSFGNQSYSI
jgi:hypothetical protein